MKNAILDENKKRFDNERLDTNLGRMYGFSIYIVFLQIILNVLNIVFPQVSDVSTKVQIPLDYYIMLSLLTLLVGIVYWVLIRHARRGKIKSLRAKSFLVNSLLYLYFAIQMLFCTMNILTHQGINAQMILILLVGMIPILKPTQSVITICVSAVYTLALMLATLWNTDAAGHSQWEKFFLSDMRAYFFIINGLTMLVSVFIYRLYVSNFTKSVQMEKINEGLEEAVRERTHELEEKTHAAEAASRAKSRFLTSVSHEIRTPLNAIMGMAHIAAHSDSIEKAHSSADEISKASTHLLGLLNNILDMSNIEEGTLVLNSERFLLQNALKEVAEIAQAEAAAKAIAFNFDQTNLPGTTVLGDKLRIKQILIGLLDNAVRYTKEDGRVGLSVRVEDETENDIKLHFSVSDSGIGMSAEQMSHLFIAFEQGISNNMKNQGLGLSLAISQHLVKMMGGNITVQSEPEKGSVFSFELLLAKTPAEIEGELTVPDLSGKRILCVEDIEINRFILSELLAETHATVEEAIDGLEAVEKFKNSPEGYYDFVFMDLLMPNMSGFDAARCIRNLDRKDAAAVPIVALSANAYPEDAEQSLQAGMNQHMAKPVDFMEVMRVLTERLK